MIEFVCVESNLLLVYNGVFVFLKLWKIFWMVRVIIIVGVLRLCKVKYFKVGVCIGDVCFNVYYVRIYYIMEFELFSIVS